MNNAAELKTTIAELDRAYWTTGTSPVSDAEYDALKAEYLAAGGEDTLHSPSVRSAGKIRHACPMLSMDRAFDAAAVVAWARISGASAIVAMPKFDGVAVVKYADGTVATRGDGEIGDIVSGLVPAFDTMTCGTGEAVVRRSDFIAGYASCRNMVSAALTERRSTLRSRIEVARYDEFVFPVTSVSVAAVEHAVDEILRVCADYPMDGIVFKVAETGLFSALGRTAHHWRGQIALKFKNRKVCVA